MAAPWRLASKAGAIKVCLGNHPAAFFHTNFTSWDMFRLPSSNEVNRCILFWMEKLLVYWGLPCVDVAKHMRAARLRALVTSPRPLKTSRNWRSSAIHDRDTAIQRYGKIMSKPNHEKKNAHENVLFSEEVSTSCLSVVLQEVMSTNKIRGDGNFHLSMPKTDIG